MKHKKNIAIFCWRDCFNPRAGGAEYVTLRHAQAWIKKGHSVTWYAAALEGQENHFRAEGITFHRFGTEKLFFLTAGWLYLRYGWGKHDVIIDQVHGLPNFSSIWAPATKRILLIHEVAGKIWSYMFPWPLSALGEFLEAMFLRLFYKDDVAWVDAHCTKADLVTVGLDARKIHVIPCAIEASTVKKITKERKLTLVFLARLVPMKGVEFALQTFNSLLQLQPDAQLWIMGSGDAVYLEKLRRLIHLLQIKKAVQFVGKVSESEKNKRLGQSHFLLHTSVKEGFGLTVLEANRQSTPAAIFNVGSLNELVFDQKNGIIAPFHNHKALAKKIHTAFKNKNFYYRLSRQAYLFQKNYNWDTFVASSTALVEEI
jgi:glycosyltransferase involved in cell wall biosynthesis